MKQSNDIEALVGLIVPRLLQGDDAALGVLRDHYAGATIREVRLTRVGAFVEFDVPDDLPRVVPESITGGSAFLEIVGLAYGAGCVVFVREGRLDCLELFAYGESWPDHVQVSDIRDVEPLIGPTTGGSHERR